MSTETMPTAMEVSLPEPEAARTEEAAVARSGRNWYFAFFFISGFCSILYELIWLRLAMAEFGVTTAMVSIVLSSFMAGLGIGSWAAGHLLRKYARRLTSPPLHLYAMAELFIGCSAVVVPLELLTGRLVLEHVGNSLSLSSSGYYIAAGIWLACSLVPWCACMGATIPLGMFAIRSDKRLESRRSFSFLYLANVLGAVAGALIPLLFIEMFGFTVTLRFGMVLNLAVCGTALWLAGKQAPQADGGDQVQQDAADKPSLTVRQMFGNSTLWLLFATGLTSMGMEVVWTREYSVFLGNLVYSFAIILGVYLAAMFIGSSVYRVWSRRRSNEGPLVWLFVWLAALIPLLTADSRLRMLPWWLRVPLGIAAFSGLLGFLTPRLVDRFSEGDPDRAGIGYAVNVAGCILGPLAAGFILLPRLDERHALTVLALPWLLIALSFALFPAGSLKRFTAHPGLLRASQTFFRPTRPEKKLRCLADGSHFVLELALLNAALPDLPTVRFNEPHYSISCRTRSRANARTATACSTATSWRRRANSRRARPSSPRSSSRSPSPPSSSCRAFSFRKNPSAT